MFYNAFVSAAAMCIHAVEWMKGYNFKTYENLELCVPCMKDLSVYLITVLMKAQVWSELWTVTPTGWM